MLVRWFDDPDSNALGWWLIREQIQLLARMGATVESDEYAATQGVTGTHTSG